MASSLPPDPYQALGIAKDADITIIRSTYRKLVLKCHPDKVTDPSLKAKKQEEFHQIQQAYELLNDDDRRREYDILVRLAQAKRDAFERGTTSSGGPRGDVRTSYGVRTAVPSDYKTSTSSSSRAYDEPRSRPSYEDDRYYDKADAYERLPRRSSATRSSANTTSKDREEVRTSTDRSRSERKKTRDREERRDRFGKHSAYAVDEEDDDRAQFQSDYARRSEEASRSHRSTDEYPDERAKKLVDQTVGAKAYISRATDQYVYRRGSGDRPEAVRRSSARPRDREREREREREHSYRERIVEERKPPTLHTSHSSPPKPSRTSPIRAHTMHSDYEIRDPPIFRRSETTPNLSSTSPTSRRDKSIPTKASTLRESVPADSGYSSPSTPEAKVKYYTYTSSSSSKGLHPEDAYHTIIREPNRRQRSPSPMHEPSSTSHRRTSPSSSRYQTIPPPLQRAATTAGRSPERPSTYDSYSRSSYERDRGRGRDSDRLYGEVGRDRDRREPPITTSYKYADISYAPRIGKENVIYSHRRPESVDRPSVQRSATYAC